MPLVDFFRNLFRGAPPAPARSASAFGHSTFSAPPSALGGASTGGDPRSQHTLRRDLLRVVMRDVLVRAGLPSAWLTLEVLAATSRNKTAGVHARLVLKQWEPRVLEHAPGLEALFVQRLTALDPLAGQWLMGLSWRLDLPPGFVPATLPTSTAWTAAAPAASPAPARTASPAASEAAQGDVIAGPVRIGTSRVDDDVRADLERLLAVRDADLQQSAQRGYDKTQPAALN